jgi:hypothetical protein
MENKYQNLNHQLDNDIENKGNLKEKLNRLKINLQFLKIFFLIALF